METEQLLCCFLYAFVPMAMVMPPIPPNIHSHTLTHTHGHTPADSQSAYGVVEVSDTVALKP